jgi:hypothetical protein
MSGIKVVAPLDPTPSAAEVRERQRLAEEATTALKRVRATAENWRTGMTGLIALVTGTLLFKGRDNIAAYDTWVRIVLGVLTGLSLLLGVLALLRFLTAAHGKPEAVSAQSVIDEGGVDVRDVRLATRAVRDLAIARPLALASAALLALALGLSWYGPAKPSTPPAFAKVTFDGSNTVCGTLVAQNGTTTELKIAGEPGTRRIPTSSLVAVVLVAGC